MVHKGHEDGKIGMAVRSRPPCFGTAGIISFPFASCVCNIPGLCNQKTQP